MAHPFRLPQASFSILSTYTQSWRPSTTFITISVVLSLVLPQTVVEAALLGAGDHLVMVALAMGKRPVSVLGIELFTQHNLLFSISSHRACVSEYWRVHIANPTI